MTRTAAFIIASTIHVAISIPPPARVVVFETGGDEPSPYNNNTTCLLQASHLNIGSDGEWGGGGGRGAFCPDGRLALV